MRKPKPRKAASDLNPTVARTRELAANRSEIVEDALFLMQTGEHPANFSKRLRLNPSLIELSRLFEEIDHEEAVNFRRYHDQLLRNLP